ncbi:substrate-binding domain-containing protein [bacterium]|nr:substrate-binding domain-containing protein [bacterium]RQV99057.1 MAG: LacI family DNA-binding transcriptional regulator [bacterium]
MATLIEIARKANVSVGTVDRVLHNRGRVSKDTRQKVLKIVNEIGYRPNILARSLSLKKTFMFGVLIPVPDQDGQYWELPMSGIRKALDELKLYNVAVSLFTYDKYSAFSFHEACQNIESSLEDLDGLVIAPVLSKASELFVSRLPESIPYVFIDSYIPDSRCLSYIGQDSFQSGVLAAKLMQMKLQEGKVIIMRILPIDYHIDDRVRGFQFCIQQNNHFTVSMVDVDREISPEIFNEVSEKILQENTDLLGIFVPSACTHQVAETLVQNDRSGSVVLIGYDLVEENRKYLKTGTIDFLISQRPALQGYQSIYSLYRHVILNESVDQKVVVPMDILTQDNVDYYQG